MRDCKVTQLSKQVAKQAHMSGEGPKREKKKKKDCEMVSMSIFHKKDDVIGIRPQLT